MIWTKRANQSPKFQTFNFSSEISPNLYFDRFFFLKVYTILAKKVHRSVLKYITFNLTQYKGVIFHDT